MKKSLISLAFGSFAIGMTEFTMMGILPDIAKDLSVDIPTAGHLIAIYALGVVIGAPILVLFTSKYPPKKVLLSLMLLFLVFHVLFTLAPDYYSLMFTRFMSGLPHGAFFGVGSVVATRLADKGKEAQSIAIMFTGMTIANLIGVPLGTYIGHAYSWRWTYLFVTLCGAATMAAIYFWLPSMKASFKGNAFKQLDYFKKPLAWILIAMISIGTGGLFAWMSYIAPLMTEVAHLESGRVPFIMVLVGLGMVFGNILGGKLADNTSPIKASIICFTSMAVCLVLVYFTIHLPGMAYFWAFTTGLISFTLGSPLQMVLINSAKGFETIAAAGGQASFNLGNTFGAYFGGLPIAAGFAYNSPLLVGIGMALSGAFIAAYVSVNKLLVKKESLIVQEEEVELLCEA
jgi:DHA1 family arabinose polymer transporter-like MFS transporter